MRVPSLGFEHQGVCVVACPDQWRTSFVALLPEPRELRSHPGLRLRAVVPFGSEKHYAFGSVSGQVTNQLYEVSMATGEVWPIALPSGWKYGPTRLHAIAGDVLAIPTRADRVARGHDGLMLGSGATFKLPPEPFPGVYDDIEAFAMRDGVVLIVAGGSAFWWRDGALSSAESLGPLTLYDLGSARQGWVDDAGALILCAGRQTFELKNGRRVIVHDPARERNALLAITLDNQRLSLAPSLKDVYPAWPGPDGALILKRYDPLGKDLLKVYWHRERTIASVPRRWLEHTPHCHDALYSPTLASLLVLQIRREPPTLYRVAWSDVERLTRTSLDDLAPPSDGEPG
jgi:hypothetical protein